MVEHITQRLSEAITSAYKGPELGVPDWTGVVKGALLELGHELGLMVCSSHPGSDHGEWLYDLVWYKTHGSEQLLEEVTLVVESEWNSSPSYIKEDFEKLLVANAPLKLFVCCPLLATQAAWLKYFHDSIHGYRLQRSGEQYLIAFIGNEEGAQPITFETLVAP